MFRALILLVFLPLIFGDCPKNGINLGSKCYIFTPKSAHFALAEVNCKNMGGHLTSVHDGFTNAFLAQEGLMQFQKGRHSDFWIGLSNFNVPGNWSWRDGSAYDFSDWKETKEKLSKSGRSCGAINIYDGFWNSDDCYKAKPYVCEVDDDVAPTITTPNPFETTTSEEKTTQEFDSTTTEFVSTTPGSVSSTPAPFPTTPGFVSSTPEPVSTTPEAVSTTPESASSTSESFPTTPVPVITTPESVSTTPESVSSTPGSFSTTHEPDFTTPSPFPTTPESVSTTSESFSTPLVPVITTTESTTPGSLSTTPESVSSTPGHFSTTPESFSTPFVPVTTTPESITTTPESVSSTPETFPTTPGFVSSTPESPSTSPEPASTIPGSASTTPEFVPTTSESVTNTATAATTTQEPTTGNCSANWHYYEPTNSCYTSTSSEFSFSFAEDECLNYDSHLASIHSADELAFVQGFAAITWHWIGLHSKDYVPTWEWTDGTVFDFALWDAGMPENYNFTCVHIFSNEFRNDKLCASKGPSICKKPA